MPPMLWFPLSSRHGRCRKLPQPGPLREREAQDHQGLQQHKGNAKASGRHEPRSKQQHAVGGPEQVDRDHGAHKSRHGAAAQPGHKSRVGQQHQARAAQQRFRQAEQRGERAGRGALFCTFLRGDERRFKQMADCLCRHQLPTIPADVGLDADQFARIVEFAPRTRPDRYTILEHLEMTPAEIHRKLAEYVDAVATR